MPELARDAVHCWIVPPAAISDGGLAAARAVLTEAERDRAARFFFERDRRLFLASHTALRLLISSYTGHPPRYLPIVADPMGRPVLEGELSWLHFNLSHSGEMALVALARDEAVGVDVELVRDFPELMDIARRYLAPLEADAIRRLEPGRRPAAFALTWPRKEAVLKALGAGLNLALDSFETDLTDRLAAVTGEGTRWRTGPCSTSCREPAIREPWRSGARGLCSRSAHSPGRLPRQGCRRSLNTGQIEPLLV